MITLHWLVEALAVCKLHSGRLKFNMLNILS